MDDTPRITELRKKLDKDPGSRLFAQLAEELRKEGRYDEAVEVARTGLEGHANYPSARLTLARALMDAGRPGEARPELEQVVKGAPDNILAGRLLGEVLEELGDPAEALKQFEQTLRLSPSDKPLIQKISDLKSSLASAPASAPATAAPASQAVQEPPPVPMNEPMGEPPAVPMPSITDGAPASVVVEALPSAVPVARSAPAALDRDLASGTFAPGTLKAPSDLIERFEQSEAQPTPAAASSDQDARMGVARPPDAPALGGAGTTAFAPSLPSVETPPDTPPATSGSLNEGNEFPSVEMPPDEAEVGATTLPLNSVTLADLYLQQGLKAEATAVLSQVIKEEPENAEARAKFAAVSAESTRPEGPPVAPVSARPPEAAPSSPPTRAQIRDRSVDSLRAFLGAVEREAAQQRAPEQGALR